MFLPRFCVCAVRLCVSSFTVPCFFSCVIVKHVVDTCGVDSLAWHSDLAGPPLRGATQHTDPCAASAFYARHHCLISEIRRLAHSATRDFSLERLMFFVDQLLAGTRSFRNASMRLDLCFAFLPRCPSLLRFSMGSSLFLNRPIYF